MPVKYTNKHNLPQTFVNAVNLDTHITKGDISVTQLVDAPQIRMLKRAHEYETDVMDMLWAVFGTAVHVVMERGEMDYHEARKLKEASAIVNGLEYAELSRDLDEINTKHFPNINEHNAKVEVTLTTHVDGMDLSGTLDRFEIASGAIEDYKVMSVWAFINPESNKKFEAQLNIYAHLLRKNGFKPKSAKLIAIFRDWSATAKLKNKDYPPNPIMFIDIKLYDDDLVLKSIKNRVALHKKAENGEYVPCSGKERWSSVDTFAVMAKGRKKAVKIVDSKLAGENYIKEHGHKLIDPYVETRLGEDKRCEKYCPVRSVCPQYKDRMEKITKVSFPSK
jgi:hypothetical protein